MISLSLLAEESLIQMNPTNAILSLGRQALEKDEQAAQTAINQVARLDQTSKDGSRPAVAPSPAYSFCDKTKVGSMLLHAIHRRKLYKSIVERMGDGGGDVHYLYQLFDWCAKNNAFIHPALNLYRQTTAHRDFAFYVDRDVPRLAPLIAFPERLLIGFLDADSDTTPLLDAKREKEFTEANSASDSDVCDFFFASLGLIVSDLLTALNSEHSDPRWKFASSLHRTRTLQNAPYFPPEIAFGNDDTNLADVLLQMVRNYVNGGPLVGKISREELLWAVSICMSHSTPLSVGNRRSIGLVPVVHLFPHGGTNTNAVVFGRSTRPQSSTKIAKHFSQNHGIDLLDYDASFYGNRYVDLSPDASELRKAQHATDMGRLRDERLDRRGNLVYVTPVRDLAAHETVEMQVMAPVCDREEESDFMWRLTCGSVPLNSLPSSTIARLQRDTREEVEARGGQYT